MNFPVWFWRTHVVTKRLKTRSLGDVSDYSHVFQWVFVPNLKSWKCWTDFRNRNSRNNRINISTRSTCSQPGTWEEKWRILCHPVMLHLLSYRERVLKTERTSECHWGSVSCIYQGHNVKSDDRCTLSPAGPQDLVSHLQMHTHPFTFSPLL